jgi:hypothetical protein
LSNIKNLFLISAIYFAFTTSAFAQDDHNHGHHNHDDQNKNWSIHLDTKTYFTSIYDANEADEEVVDIFSHSHVEGTYQFNNKLSINGTLLLEGDPAGHAHGGGMTRSGDRFFDDHPLFIEQLTVNYDDDHYGAYVGKFNPTLGVDTHDVPGWFGAFVFEEFEITERLGLGGYGELNGHRLDVSTYFADTSFLQESALYNRDTINDKDGGVANTQDFSSLSAQISGNIIDPVAYYMGYAHQGNDNGDDENRFVIGLNGHMDLTNEVQLNAMTDITAIDHLNGEADHDRTYMIVGLGADYYNWTAGVTYTKTNNDSADAIEGMDGHSTQGSIGYNFGHGFGIDVGYERTSEEGETSKRVGSLLRYHADF